MAPEVAQRDARRQRVPDQRPRRLGQDDLAAVADGGDPGRPVDVEAAVVVAGEVGFAACAGPSGRGVAPSGQACRCSARCAVDRRRDRGAGLREDREERVALGPDDDPAVAATASRMSAEVRRR